VGGLGQAGVKIYGGDRPGPAWLDAITLHPARFFQRDARPQKNRVKHGGLVAHSLDLRSQIGNERQPDSSCSGSAATKLSRWPVDAAIPRSALCGESQNGA